MIYTIHYSEPFSTTEETKSYNAKDSAEAIRAFRGDIPIGRINLLTIEKEAGEHNGLLTAD